VSPYLASGMDGWMGADRSGYRMLEDPSFSHTVSWAPGGDSFVVKVRFSVLGV
jgi:hypothetical protein